MQRLIQAFEAAHGATGCAALLGCHLGTAEGQRAFREQGLHERCREYTVSAARLAGGLVDEALAMEDGGAAIRGTTPRR